MRSALSDRRLDLVGTVTEANDGLLGKYRFYYADERNADGSVVGSKIDGPAHGDFYWELAQRPEQGEWLATFVKGKGYVPFEGTGYVKDPVT